MLFGKEDGAHIIKRFFPEQQSYGVVEDTASPRDSDELKIKLQKEIDRGTEISDDQIAASFKSQLLLKKMADPYFSYYIWWSTSNWDTYDQCCLA